LYGSGRTIATTFHETGNSPESVNAVYLETISDLERRELTLSLPSTIAVDGPAGSGKSAVSFAVAQELGYFFVDTGAFYRAVALLALEKTLDLRAPDQVAALAKNTKLDLSPDLADDGRLFTFFADSRDITSELQTPRVDAVVSIVAAMSEVRAALLDAQRQIAARGKIVMAGRDIGTVVLPDADLKIYIDAKLEQRATRRYHQRLASEGHADLDEIKVGLSQRDKIDSGREVAPLLRAADAIYLDTTAMTLEQSIVVMIKIIHQWSP
jgi:cytidylate kinase